MAEDNVEAKTSKQKKKMEFGSKADTVFVIASKCCIGITIKGLMTVSLTLETLGIMLFFCLFFYSYGVKPLLPKSYSCFNLKQFFSK